jgi:cyanophycinase-like exopeptidase
MGGIARSNRRAKARRRLLHRILQVSYQSAKLGPGLDEDSAIVVRDDHVRVLGHGAATALDGKVSPTPT